MTRISPYDALMHPWLMEDRSDSDEMTQGSGESRVGVDPKSCFLQKVLGKNSWEFKFEDGKNVNFIKT